MPTPSSQSLNDICGSSLSRLGVSRSAVVHDKNLAATVDDAVFFGSIVVLASAVLIPLACWDQRHMLQPANAPVVSCSLGFCRNEGFGPRIWRGQNLGHRSTPTIPHSATAPSPVLRTPGAHTVEYQRKVSVVQLAGLSVNVNTRRGIYDDRSKRPCRALSSIDIMR